MPNRAAACAVTPLLLALLPAALGCAVMMATQQPGRKDLGVLAAGTPRTHVIAHLGPPLWSEDRGDQTTDVFAFKQGYSKPTKAARALVHGAADVATFGLWEVVGIPVETLADGTDIKLEVRYDAGRQIEAVQEIEGQAAVERRRGWLGKIARAGSQRPQ